MAQSKSRIKSVVPSIKDNKHSFYVMNGKTYYEFIVEMENGDKGRASAMRETFRFKEGEEVFYEHVADDQHGDRLKSFVAVEQPLEDPNIKSYSETVKAPLAQSTSRYKEDPHKQSLIVAQSSVSTAVTWCATREKEVSTDDMLKIAWKIESWVLGYKDRRK